MVILQSNLTVRCVPQYRSVGSNVSACISVAVFRVKQAEEGYGAVEACTVSCYILGGGGSKFAFKLTSEQGRAISQAVNHWLPTVEARVQTRV
jgi:hypothetical protein